MPGSCSYGLVIAFVFASLPHALLAQTSKNQEETVSNAGLTANELFEKARALFNQKNYKDALEAYLKFKADFSASPDAAKTIQISLYPIAICCVQQGPFYGSGSRNHRGAGD